MPVLATMVVEYVAETAGLAAGVAQVGLLVAGAAVAVGVASVKMAGDFQASMTALQTGAGESANNIKMVSDGILAMAPQVGTTTKQLADGMYLIESAGFHGADGLTVLKNAAEGAKVGNADLKTVSDALTTAMVDYKMPVSQAASVTNDLIATVSNGKTTMQALSGSLSTILPVASTAGISLKDVSAAMATMTGAGVPAADAATYLRQTIMQLENPTTKAQNEFKAMGLSSTQVAAEMKVSLPTALQEITDAAGKHFPVGSSQYIAAVANMVGGTKSLQGILDLTGTHLDTFKSNVTNIGDAVKKGGDSINGWAKVQGDFNQKMAQATAAVQVLMIQIGTALLPVLGKVLDFLTPLISAFGAWIASGHALSDTLNFLHPVIVTVNAVIVAVNATVNASIAVFNFLWPILVKLGQVFVQIWNILVGSVVPAWNQLYAALQQAWPAFKVVGEIILGVLVVAIGILIAIVVALAEGIAAAAGGIIQIITGLVQILSGLFNILGGVFLFIMDLITGRWNKLGGDLAQIGQGIVTMFQGMWNVIAGIFNAAAGLIGGIVVGFCQGIVAFFTGLWNALVGHSIIPDMVNAIFAWFMKLPGMASQAFTAMVNAVMSIVNGLLSWIGTAASNIVNNIRNAWNALGGMAHNAFDAMSSVIQNVVNGIISWCFNAGSNIVQSIANGIRSAIGWVTNAVSAVSQAIANFLPHSPAKMGPLMDLENSGHEISNQISKGMVGGVPLINSAIGNLTKPISLGIKGVSSTSSPPLQGGTQDNSVHIYLDGKEMTNQVMKRVQRDMRGHGLKK